LIPPAVAVKAARSTAPVVKDFILVEKRMSRGQKKVNDNKSKERKEGK
jgi:hypothetical protein